MTLPVDIDSLELLRNYKLPADFSNADRARRKLKQKRILLSPELFLSIVLGLTEDPAGVYPRDKTRRVTRLPDDLTYRGAEFDAGYFVIYIESEEFEEVAPGADPPILDMVFQSVYEDIEELGE